MANTKAAKRPTQFDQNMFDEILNEVKEGRSLLDILEAKKYPSLSTFWIWTSPKTSPAVIRYGVPAEAPGEYQAARQQQADAMAIETLAIAESMDEKKRQAAELAAEALGPYAHPRDIRRAIFKAKKRSVEAAKEQIKARRWLAGRMHPNSWGDKVELAVIGDPARPVTLQLANATDDQLERIAELERQLAVERGEVVDITSEPEKIESDTQVKNVS